MDLRDCIDLRGLLDLGGLLLLQELQHLILIGLKGLGSLLS
jgi:hypothetical protein